VIGDEMVAAQLLDKLHRTGVKVWLDDFGTGFSGSATCARCRWTA
jgi:EAL domain-containing protein (putative c-di-GMP-specific phosphodiesterase class I)